MRNPLSGESTAAMPASPELSGGRVRKGTEALTRNRKDILAMKGYEDGRAASAPDGGA